EAVDRVIELTDGYGVDAVLECVGLDQSMETAIEIARPGGAVGRVGVPQHELMRGAQPSFFKNVTIGGGPAPVRAYIDELLPDVLEGRIEPGRVFDRVVDLDGAPSVCRPPVLPAEVAAQHQSTPMQVIVECRGFAVVAGEDDAVASLPCGERAPGALDLLSELGPADLVLEEAALPDARADQVARRVER